MGTFNVCLTAISAYNCIDSVCSTINIYVNSVFVIPNIFTPNGDGKNDVFEIENIDKGTWELIIYNRWGNKVYENKSYNNQWDASNTTTGVYYYTLTNYTTNIAKTGFVHVIK